MLWGFVSNTIVVCVQARIISITVIFVEEEITKYVGEGRVEKGCIGNWC